MDKTKFTFELVDKHTPDIVIKNTLKQIEEATRGYVVGKVEEYDGPIYSYTKKVGIAAALDSLQSASETVKVDIQDKLGEQSDEKHRYEVFLTVKGLEHYKYRMMFVDYNAISYPVTIVMNEKLAIEYSGRMNDTFCVDSMKDLEDMMNEVINSDTMVAFVQKLINESLRKENMERDIVKDVKITDEN